MEYKKYIILVIYCILLLLFLFSYLFITWLLIFFVKGNIPKNIFYGVKVSSKYEWRKKILEKILLKKNIFNVEEKSILINTTITHPFHPNPRYICYPYPQ